MIRGIPTLPILGWYSVIEKMKDTFCIPVQDKNMKNKVYCTWGTMLMWWLKFNRILCLSLILSGCVAWKYKGRMPFTETSFVLGAMTDMLSFGSHHSLMRKLPASLYLHGRHGIYSGKPLVQGSNTEYGESRYCPNGPKAKPKLPPHAAEEDLGLPAGDAP